MNQEITRRCFVALTAAFAGIQCYPAFARKADGLSTRPAALFYRQGEENFHLIGGPGRHARFASPPYERLITTALAGRRAIDAHRRSHRAGLRECHIVAFSYASANLNT